VTAALLPNSRPTTQLNYSRLLASIPLLIREHRILREAMFTQALLWAAFNAFWATLAALHPNMAEIYRSRLASLHEALGPEETLIEAAQQEIIRSLVNEIVRTPEGGELKVDLRGDLAGILAIAVSGKKPAPDGSGFSDKRDGKTQFELVAGVGFEPTTFRL
jgi:hypothetical protein